jgi:hypothetical protein
MGDESSVRRKRNDNHRKNRTSQRRSSRRPLALSHTIARLIVATLHSIQIRRYFNQKLILFIAGLGIIFLASVVQTFGTNWLGQACPYPGPCLHWEWLAVGVVLTAAAYFAYKVVNNSRH